MFQPLSLLSRAVCTRRRVLTTAVLGSTALGLSGVRVGSPPGLFAAPLPGVLRGLPSLGTVVECQAFHASHQQAEAAVRTAFTAIGQVDRDMSSFRPESDIGRVNQAQAQQAVRLHHGTLTVLQTALRVAQASNGCLDITIAPLLDQWGFFERRQQAPSSSQVEQALALVNYRDVHLDAGRHTIRLRRPGMRLDLGSLGKGYAVDRAIDAMLTHGIERGLVNAGGDLRLLGAPPDGHPWLVGVQHPLTPSRVLLALWLDAGSVATSGNYLRYRVYDGRRYGHLIHPRHGYPVHTALSTTVVAPTAMQADALATAAMLLGPHDGMQWLADQPGIAGLVVESLPADAARLRVRVTPGLGERVVLLARNAFLER